MSDIQRVYFVADRCLGCCSCEFACAVEHSRSRDPLRAHLEEETPVSRRKISESEGARVTVTCCHCGLAACVEACIAGAMQKNDDGEVECDRDKCINCGMCVMVCSFGAVKPGKTGVFKCDMCPDTDAACVTACPTGALFAATPEEYEKKMQEKRKTGTEA